MRRWVENSGDERAEQVRRFDRCLGNLFCGLRSPGVYQLDLKIAASSARPISQELELSFTGVWSDDADTIAQEGS